MGSTSSSSSYSISACAKAAIDKINQGETRVNLAGKYVEIIILLFEEEIIIISELYDIDAAAIQNKYYTYIF
jgi:hypothetical protein